MNPSTLPFWIITGATSGVGRALGLFLAAKQFPLVLVGRHPGQLAQAAQLCRQRGSPSCQGVVLDLADLGAVGRWARTLTDPGLSLAGIVHGAGVMDFVRREGVSGFENTLCVNYLAPFLINTILEGKLAGSPRCRVLLVAGSSFLLPAEFQLPAQGLDKGWTGPAQAVDVMVLKMLHARLLARRWGRAGARIWSFHPGFVRSQVFRGAPWYLKMAACLAWPFFSSRCREGEVLAVGEGLPASGSLVEGGKAKTSRPRNLDQDLEEELWGRSLGLCGPFIS